MQISKISGSVAWIAGIAGLIVLSGLIVTLISLSGFSGTAALNCTSQDDPHFYVYNNDSNRSHSVSIFVYNSSGQLVTEGSYEMARGDPSQGIKTTVHQPATRDTDYSVTFIVDGNISTHFESLAISPDCSEAFFLEPQWGIMRPFDLWCSDRPCTIEPPAEAERIRGYPHGLVIGSFGVPVLHPDDLGLNSSEELYSHLQKIADESEQELDNFYYPRGPVIGHGYDMYGTIVVQINKEQDINQSSRNEIYRIIERAGEKNGIKNIPCRFLSMGMLEEDLGTKLRENLPDNVTNIFLAGQKQDLADLRWNLSDAIEANYVPLETARFHATVELARMMYDESFGPGVVDFGGVTLNQNPIVIYDDSGRYRSYYKFTTGTPDGQGSFIIVSASKVFGHSIQRAGIGSYNSEFILLQKAQKIFDANYTGYHIRSVKFVANCWGQVVRLDLIDPLTQNQTILTMDNWGIVGERNCGMDPRAMTPKEISENIAAWEKSDAYYQAVSAKALSEGINLSAPYSLENAEKIREIFSKAGGY